MSKTLKISVVTPSYNQSQFIESTITSVINQDYDNVEYIIIDGGSNDGTMEIIEKYADKISYYVSERDNGQTHAIMKGFERSSGDILCWLNSDDVLEPHTLSVIADYFTLYPERDFVYGNATWIDGMGNILYKRKEIPFVRWLWYYAYNYIPQPSAFWRRSIYEAVGGIDENFSLAMDTDLFSRMSTKAKIYHLPHFMSQFRVHGQQRSTVQRKKLEAEAQKIMDREFGRHVGSIEKHVGGFLARSTRIIVRTLIYRSR